MDQNYYLEYYSRPEIKEAIVKYAKDREVGPRLGEGFGKRPDVLEYPNDVDFFMKKGLTSFHVSEERWDNPLNIITGMKKKELDEIRTGWDLILDVDCPIWKWSKKITHLLIEELKKHDIKSISCKFSGNKGFHIAVPWEIFPKIFNGESSTSLFPELPRRILSYLVNRSIRDDLALEIENDEDEIQNLCKELDITREQLFVTKCKNCGENLHEKKKKEIEIRCSECGSTDINVNKHIATCNNCNNFFDVEDEIDTDKYAICSCGVDVNKKENQKRQVEVEYILDVDAILIAPRHLYRAPYSLHEKSGLVSIPCDPNKVLYFEKEQAKPENIEILKHPFMHVVEGDDASNLCLVAWDYTFKKEELIRKQGEEEREKRIKEHRENTNQEPLPPEDFPPCIKNIQKGMKDGKKRALFCYINFLFGVGWTYDEVEKEVNEWNERNEEPVRENMLISFLNTYKRNLARQTMMPPNCSNKAYYKDIGLCQPNGMCKTIQNPVQYTKKIDWIKKQKENQATSDKLEDKQKLLRKEFRTFPTFIKKIDIYVEKHEGKLPDENVTTKAAKELYDWIVRQREKQKEGDLNPNHTEELVKRKIIEIKEE